ncbi:protein bric-a-brac 2-like isoform X15 [Eriocheir sinensis]|uniref:protein bric-a-brac 2-like isoform X15 n=1 Tax=Eriocheir sinensis TaxID=95602 RepID=UPI0021C9D55B|nr:protein bric-a-brac 2-like isoform X15 [Eriocheir sinensis]XP_050686730.1 protein bric-a-brac 2-like isoform X15 [Eriocheir sinensis]XP_050686731.1 protein bric-a-brac 2-like isoform X15 [Eriocheir sinensis]
MADGMLSLSWNNHRATFCHILATLRDKERYTDVTVACEGKFYPVHKLVLSTCSEYFEKIFENTPCKHPVIVLKDVNRSDLEALFCYMYEGAVSVAQSNLGRLIKAAEVLRIKGLAVPDEPPISDGGVRRGASSHHHHSSDDRSSPHPKRRRREESNSHTHLRTRSSPSPPSSPRPSPLHDREDSHPALRSRSDSQWGDQGANERDDGGVDGLGEDRMGDHSAASHTAPTPPQVEVMMDETLVKEEMIDQEDTGQEDLMDSGMDYASVGSDSRLDGSATGGGGEEDHILPGKYEPKANPGHQAIPEAVVEALAGPSGMQTWLGGGEMPSGFSGLEGYAGAEGTQDLHAPSQAPAAHQLMSPGNTDLKTRSGDMLASNKGAVAQGKIHHCPYCAYRSNKTTNLYNHVRVHTGEKPFTCPHCPYRATQETTLKFHIRTHTGEKPYACDVCSYRSIKVSTLRRHRLTHQLTS